MILKLFYFAALFFLYMCRILNSICTNCLIFYSINIYFYRKKNLCIRKLSSYFSKISVQGKLHLFLPRDQEFNFPSDFPRNIVLDFFFVSEFARTNAFERAISLEDPKKRCELRLCPVPTNVVIVAGKGLSRSKNSLH